MLRFEDSSDDQAVDDAIADGAGTDSDTGPYGDGYDYDPGDGN